MPTQPLAYAPSKPSILRRRPKTLVALAILITVGIALWQYHNEIAVRARRLYWGYQCARHVIPNGTVLLESDPVKAASLLAQGDDYVDISRPTPGLSLAIKRASVQSTVAVYCPHDWVMFGAVEPRASRFWPPIGWHYEPMIYLHERSSHDGSRWIVAVRGNTVNLLDLPRRIPAVVVPIPRFFERLPLPCTGLGDAYSGQWVPAVLSLGVTDEEDSAHFSIPFKATLWDKRVKSGVVDAYVQADGTLKWKLRDPATTQVH